MRTTLSIDDDVLRAVKDRARRESRTAGEVISELARDALTRPRSRSDADPDETPQTRNGFAVIPSRGPVVTSSLVRELLDEDE